MRVVNIPEVILDDSDLKELVDGKRLRINTLNADFLHLSLDSKLEDAPAPKKRDHPQFVPGSSLSNFGHKRGDGIDPKNDARANKKGKFPCPDPDCPETFRKIERRRIHIAAAHPDLIEDTKP